MPDPSTWLESNALSASLLLGIFVGCLIAGASYASVARYRRAHYRLKRHFQALPTLGGGDHPNDGEEEQDEENHQGTVEGGAGNDDNDTDDIEAALALEPQQSGAEEEAGDGEHNDYSPTATETTPVQDLVLELTMRHGVYYVLLSSPIIILAIFVDVYRPLVVIYALLCSFEVSEIIIYPSSDWVLRSCYHERRGVERFYKPLFKNNPFGTSLLSLFALIQAFALAAVWIYVAFEINEQTNSFYWIYQNIMGVCIALSFLKKLVVNSLKVSAFISGVTMVYDFFFIFVVPHIIGRGETSFFDDDMFDSDFCQGNPDHVDCQAEPFGIPMVLTIPWINDERGRYSLLGLGDILMPGLLVSFAARLDEAKRITSLVNLHVSNVPGHWWKGYFVPQVTAYSVGLVAAFLAVALMGVTQPALIYIMPSCLATFFYVGRSELRELWNGPECIPWANNLVRYAAKEVPYRNS